MKSLLRFLSRSGWPVWGMLLVIAALCGLLTSEIWRAIAVEGLKRDLNGRINLESVNLQNLSLDGKAMGALKLAGQLNDEIRAATQVIDKQQAEQGNVANMSMGLLAQSIEAEHAFVANLRGMISSDWDAAGNKVIGIDVRFRPYYLAARQGVENVHGAVSMSTGKRMIYVSAPVYSSPGDSGPTSGAVVARFNIDHLDSFLGRLDNVVGLLVTPHGVVFSSSKPEWVLRPLGDIDAKRLAALRDTRQYGRAFNEDAMPSPLPAFQGDRLAYEGREYLVAKRPIVWNDPGGNWEMILLADLATGIPLQQRIGIGVLAAGLFILLGAISLRLLRSQIKQRNSAAELEAIAQRQTHAAQRKAELAEATRRMQGADNLTELARIFFSEMHHQTSVLQGAAYIFIDETQRLELIGSYACPDSIPEQIPSGEGLLGQSVIERKARVLQQDTSAMSRVHSGLGSSCPQRVLIAPLLLGDQIQGAVELAWLSNDLPDEVQQQTDDLLALFAMNIEIQRRSAHTQSLLDSTVAAERASAAQANFQQVLVDTIPYPVFYKGPDACFLGVNRAYEQTFNVQRADLVGKCVLDLDYLPETNRITYQAEDEAVIAEAGQVRHELQIPLADGKLHDTLYFVSGFRNADGTPGGLVGTFIDISEQKEAARELDRLADLKRFHKLAHGREMRILELKREINAMANAIGQPEPYSVELVEPVGDHDISPNPDYRTELTPDGRPLQLGDLVNLDELQTLLTNFCEAVGIASAIIDVDGKILAAARWQRACTDFHRVNPQSCARCIESDTGLALQLQEGQSFTMYKCKNGMSDAAAPIIVEGQHLANVFIGQFHVEKPNVVFFQDQARQFGFDETDYLAAVTAAPVIDEQRLPAILSFLSGFARMISTMSLARRRADLAQTTLEEQAELLKRERVAALSLAEDAEQARIALEAVAKESLA